MAAAVASLPLPEGLRLGFIGAGKMAESIARGVAMSGILPSSSIRTAHRLPDRADVFRSFGVKILETNAQVRKNLIRSIFIYWCFNSVILWLGC